MHITYPDNNRHSLRTRITSIVTGILIFVFAGILQKTSQTGPSSEGTSQESTEQYTEHINIAAIYSGTISPNSSLYAELLNWPIPQNLIGELTSRFSRLFDLRSSRPGDSFTVFMGQGDTILAFEYQTSDWKRYRLDRDGSDYIATVDEIGLDRKIKRVEGVIESSLWDALLPLLPDMEIFSDLTDIFGWEIDFLTEPRAGDRFSLIFEVFEKDGTFVRPGKILAAQYIMGEDAHRAFLFEDSTGHEGYFNEKGYALKKSFLKSPLNYRRISSRFSMSRLHPIRKIYRPHLGVDYAAASGTPVVAPGDGQVVYKGWRTGFGNYLEIRHPGGITTCYGHLRGYASGISRGAHVAQSQVIGYVGSTGESTGPHLDYRVKKNGRFVDPLKMVVPAALPVKEEYMPEFQLTVAEYMPYLDNPLPTAVLAQRN